MKITGEITGQLDIKRFYIDGLKVSSNCEQCNEEIKFENYLFYPSAGEKNSIYFYCKKCDVGWYEKAILNITLTPTEDEKEYD